MMHAVYLASLALVPWVNAQSTSSSSPTFDSPIKSTRITLQGPETGELQSCVKSMIQWIFTNPTSNNPIPFSIGYSNEGINGNNDVVTGLITTEAVAQSNGYIWPVNIPVSGRYFYYGSANGIVVAQSSSFLVNVVDTSCLSTTSTSPSSTTSGSTTSLSTTGSPPNSTGSPDPSEVPATGGGGNGSKIASIVGAIFGVVIFVALLAAFFFYRRQRSLKSRTYANSKPEKPKRNRKWGGLTSVDDAPVPAPQGIPTVPYAAAAFTNSRVESFGKPSDDEKGIPVYEDESLGDEVPTLSPRSRNRFSTGVMAATLAQQNSGLAAFNNERARTSSLKGVSPSGSVVEDPFSDAAFRARSQRSQSLSVPSTAHPSPRSSGVPALPTSSSSSPTNEGPLSLRSSDYGRPESTARSSTLGTIGRSTSANAVARPARKPVPQYDSSIEMTSALGHSSYAHSSAHNSMANLSDSHGMLSSSVDSTSPWLADRAPVATRNIGLASQGDGPVHYLIPDMPPPPRD